MLWIVAFGSILIGTLASLQQNKFKRLLAYSSIVHVGFVLIGFTTNSITTISTILLYVTLYVVMNIALWTFYLSFNINNKPIKYLTDLTGISKLNKPLFFIVTLILFSLAGIPPLAGFFSKMFILMSAIKNQQFGLVIISTLISVVSAFYYIRVVKIIYFENVNKVRFVNSMSKGQSLLIILNSNIVLLFFFFPNYILTYLNKIYLYMLI